MKHAAVIFHDVTSLLQTCPLCLFVPHTSHQNLWRHLSDWRVSAGLCDSHAPRQTRREIDRLECISTYRAKIIVTDDVNVIDFLVYFI